MIFDGFPHLPSMVSVYADEEESVSRGGEDFGEDSGEEDVLTVVFVDYFNSKTIQNVKRDLWPIFVHNRNIPFFTISLYFATNFHFRIGKREALSLYQNICCGEI